MKKISLFAILLFLSSSIYSQNFIQTILSYNNLSINEIEEKLIFNDFEFVRKRIADENGGGGFLTIIEEEWYETRFYEKTNYLGEKIEIIFKVYEKRQDHDVIIWTNSKSIFKQLLSNLKELNYNVTDGRVGTHSEGRYGQEKLKVGDYSVVADSRILYRNKNKNIISATLKVAEVTSLAGDFGSFYYNKNTIVTEYEFVIN